MFPLLEDQGPWDIRLPSVLWSSSAHLEFPLYMAVDFFNKEQTLFRHKFVSYWLSFKVQKVTKHLYSSESQPWQMSHSTAIWPVDFWIPKTPRDMVSRVFSKSFRKKTLLLKSHRYYEGLFFQVIYIFNDFNLHFLRDLGAKWYHLGELFHCNSAKLAAWLCPIMITATPGKGRMGDGLWQKAGVDLDKQVEKNILSLEHSKQNEIKQPTDLHNQKNLKICWAFPNSCETCICFGANQAGKMPLPKSPSCSRDQRSKEKQNSNLGKWIQNLKILSYLSSFSSLMCLGK